MEISKKGGAGTPKAEPETAVRALRAAIAANIQRAIANSGRSQNEVGRILGTTGSTVSSWCTGRTQPSLEQLAMLCQMTSANPDVILCTIAPGRAGTLEHTESPAQRIEKARLFNDGAVLGRALVEVLPDDYEDVRTEYRLMAEDIDKGAQHIEQVARAHPIPQLLAWARDVGKAATLLAAELERLAGTDTALKEAIRKHDVSHARYGGHSERERAEKLVSELAEEPEIKRAIMRYRAQMSPTQNKRERRRRK